jgi:hypothetical protein
MSQEPRTHEEEPLVPVLSAILVTVTTARFRSCCCIDEGGVVVVEGEDILFVVEMGFCGRFVLCRLVLVVRCVWSG